MNQATYNRLNYNITGNGWTFPILSTTAKVYFDNVPAGSESAFYSHVQAKAYSGKLGSLENLHSAETKNPTLSQPYVQLQLTKTLYNSQGVTLDILFPKGYVKPVTATASIMYFTMDNFQILISVCLLAILIFVSIKIWSRYGNDEELSNVTIPEYDPPEGLSPEEVGFLNNKGKYDSKQLAAIVADIAVRKIIKIEKIKSDKYKLTLLKFYEQTINSLSQNQKIFLTAFSRSKLEVDELAQVQSILAGLAAKIFSIKNETFLNDLAEKAGAKKELSITIGNKYLKYMEDIKKSIEENIRAKILEKYYKHNYTLLLIPIAIGIPAIALTATTFSSGKALAGGILPLAIWGFLITKFFRSFIQSKSYKKPAAVFTYIFFGLIIFLLIDLFIFLAKRQSGGLFGIDSLISPESLAVTMIASVVLIFGIDYITFQTRTALGTEVQNKIEGLKLFLTTTEERRYSSDLHKDIPQTMDVYEKYLPYAIALGVEPQWNKKFKDVLDAAAIQESSGSVNSSFVYGTNYGKVFSGSGGFFNNFASTLNTSTVAPSSSGSGFGGGGGW